MRPPDCRNSEILTPGVPTVDLWLSPVLSRNLHLAFLLGACHTMESHLFWEGARPLFPTAKAESLTLAELGTPRLHRPFPVWTFCACEEALPEAQARPRPLVHSQPILSSSFGIPTVPRAQWQGSWGGKPPCLFCTRLLQGCNVKHGHLKTKLAQLTSVCYAPGQLFPSCPTPHDASSPLNQSTALQRQFFYSRDLDPLSWVDPVRWLSSLGDHQWQN